MDIDVPIASGNAEQMLPGMVVLWGPTFEGVVDLAANKSVLQEGPCDGGGDISRSLSLQ